MAETETTTLAVFVDFENLALAFYGSRSRRFEIEKVLTRLVDKGNIVVKKAYADWTRYQDYRQELHEWAIELIEIPKRGQVGKNSADIRLVVDAMDLCYSKAHINTFCIVSGDSDFSPLVSKLKENGKRVIGLGMKDSTSALLIENCHEFIFYEDLERTTAEPSAIDGTLPKEKAQAFKLLVEAIQALLRENKDVLFSSQVKETMKRKRPSFDESYHGYKSFTALLEDAESQGVVTLKTDPRSGTYVITGYGKGTRKK